MKNVVLMVFTGIALFLGAMVGLLAAQGRLTYEGTRNIPILSRLFSKPAQDQDESAAESKGLVDLVEANRANRVLPYRRSGSTPDKVDSGGTVAPDAPRDGRPNVRQPSPAQAMQDAYPLDLFDFKKVKADISVEELNEMVRAVRKKQREQKALDAALEKRRRDLEDQMADVLHRQQEVVKQMQQVTHEREKLDRRIEEFHKRVLLVRQDELAGLKENARNIANLDPEIGRDLILSWWNQGAAGETRAVKTLSLMNSDSVEAILETMETDKIRKILDKRLTLARMKTEGGNR